MVVLYYLIFVSALMLLLLNSGVVFATVDLVKHRKAKEKLDYKNHLIQSLSLLVIVLIVFVVCIAILKVFV